MKRIHIDRTMLKRMYVYKRLSQNEIGKRFNCSQWVISSRLRHFGIKTRPRTWNLSRRIYIYNKQFLSNISGDISWVLGLLVSDGFVSKSNFSGYFGLSLSEKDKDAIFKVRKILEYTGPVLKGKTFLKHKDIEKVFRFRLLHIHDINMVKKLAAIGIKKNKTLNEKFLKCIAETENEEKISSFIRGIYDGDGSLLYDKKRNSMCFQIVGTLELLCEIQKYLISYCHVNKTVLTRNISGKNHYALRYRGNIQTVRILEWIYKYSNPSNRMDRKFNKFYKTRRVINK